LSPVRAKYSPAKMKKKKEEEEGSDLNSFR
jgi:hypothetical protein